MQLICSRLSIAIKLIEICNLVQNELQDYAEEDVFQDIHKFDPLFYYYYRML